MHWRSSTRLWFARWSLSNEIQRAVLRIRGQNVMLDSDLAALYGVDVKALNQAGSFWSSTSRLT